jgi:hypothetical protein
VRLLKPRLLRQLEAGEFARFDLPHQGSAQVLF